VCVCSLRYPACNTHAPYSHLWPVRIYNIFRHYLKNTRFSKPKIYWTQNVFWFSLQLVSETFLILRRTQQDSQKCKLGVHVKFSLFLSYHNETLIFFDIFSKNPQISNSMKIRPVGAQLFHEDRHMTKLCCVPCVNLSLLVYLLIHESHKLLSLSRKIRLERLCEEDTE